MRSDTTFNQDGIPGAHTRKQQTPNSMIRLTTWRRKWRWNDDEVKAHLKVKAAEAEADAVVLERPEFILVSPTIQGSSNNRQVLSGQERVHETAGHFHT